MSSYQGITNKALLAMKAEIKAYADGLMLAAQAYALSIKSKLGTPVDKNNNTAYLASTDGIVIANGGGGATQIYIGDSQAQTTLRDLYVCVVLAGEYWKATNATTRVLWIPIL
jgi:adenosylcobinamide amidohydrolase